MSQDIEYFEVPLISHLKKLGYIGWVLKTKNLNPCPDLTKAQYDERWKISFEKLVEEQEVYLQGILRGNGAERITKAVKEMGTELLLQVI